MLLSLIVLLHLRWQPGSRLQCPLFSSLIPLPNTRGRCPTRASEIRPAFHCVERTWSRVKDLLPVAGSDQAGQFLVLGSEVFPSNPSTTFVYSQKWLCLAIGL